VAAGGRFGRLLASRPGRYDWRVKQPVNRGTLGSVRQPKRQSR
jgi:hypothetical protein